MKKLLSLAIVLCLTVAMAVPAMAAGTITNPNNDGGTVIDNKNPDGTDVTLPGAGPYTQSGQQQDGESYGFSTQDYDAANDQWITDSDDDGTDGTPDTDGTDIYVWAKVSNDGAKLYKIDIAWGAMKFEFSGGGKQWNVDSHTYTDLQGTPEWLEDDGDGVGYLDDINNKIEITNHSNCGITATFAYAMDGATANGDTMFNDDWDSNENAVVGGFYKDNTNAKAAAAVLTDIIVGSNDGTVDNTTITNLWLTSNIYDGTSQANAIVRTAKTNAICLPTADKYNHGGNSDLLALPVSGDESSGYTNNGNDIDTNAARTQTINFAFSGTPDAGRGSVLDTFKKVGVITVTVEPNLDPALNASVVD